MRLMQAGCGIIPPQPARIAGGGCPAWGCVRPVHARGKAYVGAHQTRVRREQRAGMWSQLAGRPCCAAAQDVRRRGGAPSVAVTVMSDRLAVREPRELLAHAPRVRSFPVPSPA